MQDFQDIHGSSTFVPKEEEAIGSLRRGTVSCDPRLERSGWVPSGEYSVGVYEKHDMVLAISYCP